MEIGDITAVVEYSILILFYIIMAQMVIILLPRAKVCLSRIEAVLYRKPEILDSREPENFTERPEEVVRFQNVCFQFQDAEKETLENIDFVCRRSETTAIIGGTGSGKSTIAKLLLRFHDTCSGSVFFNGKEIKTVKQEELRKRIAYVPQKAWLFSGTIEENLRHGKEDASEEEMKKALHTAQAKFVFDLPEGLHTGVAQGGRNFSGGQSQRLSIARAMMKKADLYIFDDSFSALDFKTDAALRKALAEETKDAAVLIIAQRMNTILHAHQILVLDEGKIVGKGTHEELMKNCRVYQEIAESQRKGEKSHEG